MAWKIAECSLSTGRMRAPQRAARPMTSGPATTSVSLLARATVLPASTAAQVACSPAAPTTADTTTSTSASAANRTAPASPERSCVSRGNFDRSAAANAAASVMTAIGGRNSRHCFASASHLEFAARPTIFNRSGRCLATSSVLVPIDPVEPSTAIRFATGERFKRHRWWKQRTRELYGDFGSRRKPALVTCDSRIPDSRESRLRLRDLLYDLAQPGGVTCLLAARARALTCNTRRNPSLSAWSNSPIASMLALLSEYIWWGTSSPHRTPPALCTASSGSCPWPVSRLVRWLAGPCGCRDRSHT